MSSDHYGSSSFATFTLLPGQDKTAPSAPMSRASCFVFSCGFRLPEVGLSEIRKPQVRVLAALKVCGAGAKIARHTMTHDDLSHHESSIFPADSFC